MARYVSIWFSQLIADWWVLRQPTLACQPFVVAAPDHGRLKTVAASLAARAQGIFPGMTVADARAVCPGLEVLDDQPDLPEKLLQKLAGWCIRFTPLVSIILPDRLLLDASGCAHLWGGEEPYLNEVLTRLTQRGYEVRAAMADTPGAAMAVSHFGARATVVEKGNMLAALLPLPPTALRLEPPVLDKLQKLGLYTIGGFIQMPRNALRRRFGQHTLLRIDQALGTVPEHFEPYGLPATYSERLPCLEPIATATGIAIALERLLETICARLLAEGKGLRKALLKCHRIDDEVQEVSVSTSRPSCNARHLFRLFELEIALIAPGLGIELFVLEAPIVEDAPPMQETFWGSTGQLEDAAVAELLDRVSGRLGSDAIARYLPAEHYWPERSIKPTFNLSEKAATAWPDQLSRPVLLLSPPEKVEVAAPVPDYPPILFRHKGQVHRIKRADGPERIEQEWWLQDGQHRDYYAVEDEGGGRFWLFRSGHYIPDNASEWFLHGYFA